MATPDTPNSGPLHSAPDSPVAPARIPTAPAAPVAVVPVQVQTIPTTPPVERASREILIISHSNLFYWWPVWAVGFICAAISWMSGQAMVVAPKGIEPVQNVTVEFPPEKEGAQGKSEKRDAWVLPAGKHLEKGKNTKVLVASSNKNMGIFFCITLLVVIFITNVPLRGLWSVMVIGLVVMLSIIFALLDWWTVIFEAFHVLDIRINLGGYLLISTVLFLLWLIVFFFFDQQLYMVFTPGLMRVRLEIGDAETAYDTMGMTVQKQRSDLFRHWFLGLGSGDLVVRTSGAQAHTFDLPNVLFVGRKVKEIEALLSSKQVVTSP
ncbi:MAG: hypothetical protein K2X38_15865 [Gemmataceae bacterium]|nr:hypothetical protein [Gemmataceae bacterium]